MNQGEIRVQGEFALEFSTMHRAGDDPTFDATAEGADANATVVAKKTSGPLAIGASASEIAAAAQEALIDAECEEIYYRGDVTGTKFYDRDTFDQSSDNWQSRNGGDPAIENRAYCGRKGLHMTSSWGRNFERGSGLETGQSSRGYDISKFPFMCMAWRIPRGVDVNMLIDTNVTSWRSVSLTQTIRSPSYPKAADWGIGGRNDGRWHYDCINLEEQLKAALGDRPIAVTSVIWHSAGGGSPFSGGAFDIDEFAIVNQPFSMRRTLREMRFRLGVGGAPDARLDVATVRASQLPDALPLIAPPGTMFSTEGDGTVPSRSVAIELQTYDCRPWTHISTRVVPVVQTGDGIIVQRMALTQDDGGASGAAGGGDSGANPIPE